MNVSSYSESTKITQYSKQQHGKQGKKKLSWDDGRHLEAAFCRGSEGWARIPSGSCGSVAPKGTTHRVGDVFSISKRLNQVKDELDRCIDVANASLAQFPVSPAVPLEFIYEALARFFRDVDLNFVKGNASARQDGVVQRMREQAIGFRDRLQDVAPVFLPSSKSNVDVATLHRPSLLHLSQKWTMSSRMKYTVEDVEKQCRGSVLRETTDFAPFEATRYYMERVATAWGTYAVRLLDDAYNLMSEKLLELIEIHFRMYSNEGLQGQVRKLAEQLLAHCNHLTKKQIDFLVMLEIYPRTFHQELFEELRTHYEEYYGQAYTIEGGVLQTMARTRALYDISFRRFADIVPLTIDLQLVNEFGKRVENHIITGMNLPQLQEQELHELLTLSDPMTAKRDALKEEVRRLKAAKARLPVR